jgi:hypothetical protein
MPLALPPSPQSSIGRLVRYDARTGVPIIPRLDGAKLRALWLARKAEHRSRLRAALAAGDAGAAALARAALRALRAQALAAAIGRDAAGTWFNYLSGRSEPTINDTLLILAILDANLEDVLQYRSRK